MYIKYKLELNLKVRSYKKKYKQNFVILFEQKNQCDMCEINNI